MGDQSREKRSKMPLANFFNKLNKTVQNRVFVAIIAIVCSAGYTQFDKLLLKRENIVLEIELKKRSIQLESLKGQNMELQIELVKCQAEYRNVKSSLDDIPLVCWKRDVQTGMIIYVNDAFVRDILRPMGKGRFDLLFKPDHLVFGKDYQSEYRSAFEYVVSTGKSITKNDIRGNRKFGTSKWKSTWYPIYENGSIVAVGGIAYKI